MSYGQGSLFPHLPEAPPKKEPVLYMRYDSDRGQHCWSYWTGERWVVNYWLIGNYDFPHEDVMLEMVSAQELVVALR